MKNWLSYMQNKYMKNYLLPMNIIEMVYPPENQTHQKPQEANSR